jgi:hypothetical protein
VHRSLSVLAAVLATGTVLASAAPAAADGPFVPGDTRTIQLRVPATWSAARQVDVTVGSLTQTENGCLEPEDKAGDDCSSDEGELAGQLSGTVTLGLPDGGNCTPGASADLFPVRPQAVFLAAPPSGVRCLFVELTFEDGALNNLAQSDSVSFGLDLVARGLPTTANPDVRTSTDEQVGGRVPSNVPADGNGATGSGDTATDQNVDGTTTTAGDDADQVDADSGALAAAPAAPVEPAREGAVLDRLEAEFSVGDDGVVVQTEAAESSLQGQLLAWASLLLGAVALGWFAFMLVLRRRRKQAAP